MALLVQTENTSKHSEFKGQIMIQMFCPRPFSEFHFEQKGPWSNVSSASDLFSYIFQFSNKFIPY